MNLDRLSGVDGDKVSKASFMIINNSMVKQSLCKKKRHSFLRRSLGEGIENYLSIIGCVAAMPVPLTRAMNCPLGSCDKSNA